MKIKRGASISGWHCSLVRRVLRDTLPSGKKRTRPRLVAHCTGSGLPLTGCVLHPWKCNHLKKPAESKEEKKTHTHVGLMVMAMVMTMTFSCLRSGSLGWLILRRRQAGSKAHFDLPFLETNQSESGASTGCRPRRGLARQGAGPIAA